MMTSKQIRFLLEMLREKYGPGYAEDKEVGALQATLSIMLQLAETRERAIRKLKGEES